MAVLVAYGDSVRANPSYPNPWAGSPDTKFAGDVVYSEFDGGAVRVDNMRANDAITITDLTILVPWASPAAGGPIWTKEYWGTFLPMELAPGERGIFTQCMSTNTAACPENRCCTELASRRHVLARLRALGCVKRSCPLPKRAPAPHMLCRLIDTTDYGLFEKNAGGSFCTGWSSPDEEVPTINITYTIGTDPTPHMTSVLDRCHGEWCGACMRVRHGALLAARHARPPCPFAHVPPPPPGPIPRHPPPPSSAGHWRL